jgi:hypothetical protein
MGQFRSIRAGVLFFLFACSMYGLTSALTQAQGTATLPVLNASVLESVTTNKLFVHGDRFTPGGDVYIDISYSWDEQLASSRWVKASDTVYVPYARDDSLGGFVQGGVVSEMFDIPCSANIRVSAYDEGTDSWSNALDVVSGCGDQDALEPESVPEPMLPPTSPNPHDGQPY